MAHADFDGSSYQWLRSYTAEGIKWAYSLPEYGPAAAVDRALQWHRELYRKFPYDIVIEQCTPTATLVIITTRLKGTPCPTLSSAIGPAT